MFEKAGKESQYNLAPPSRSALVGRGKGRDMNACDFKITNHNPNHKSFIQGSNLIKTYKNMIGKQ